MFPCAAGCFVLADVSRLQEREVVRARLVARLLGSRRQRRNSAVRWIDDQRCPPTGVPLRGEDGVVGAGEILNGALGRQADIAESRHGGTFLVELGAFGIGEELPVFEFRRPLQRDLKVLPPDPLQIRLAPRCPALEASRVGTSGPGIAIASEAMAIAAPLPMNRSTFCFITYLPTG
jgi:hypothetical protein